LGFGKKVDQHVAVHYTLHMGVKRALLILSDVFI